MYLTFEEYGGELNETAFINYETEAETFVDWYTFNRLAAESEIPEKVKTCMRKLIELLQLRDSLVAGLFGAESGGQSTGSGSIRSQSNDGVSISYNTIEASDLYKRLSGIEVPNNDYEMTIRRYLSGIKNSKGQNLLYRGLYPNE